jgi:hypothetical protein
MKRLSLPVVCLCAFASLARAADNSVSDPTGFNLIETTYQSYDQSTGQFDLPQPIGYQLPNPNRFGVGPYPVFIWVPGSFESYEDPLAQFLLAEMTARGFLAATVSYDNSESVQMCSTYTPRAKGMFDAKRTTSALKLLCGLSSASCQKGVVVMGASQGGFMAVLARNYAPQVRAVYALSMSDYAQNAGVSFPCVDKQNTVIPADRLMIVNGAADQVFGGQTPLMNVSGLSCPQGSTQCWSPDKSGGGWYMVQNSEVESGRADHCYFLDGNKSNGLALSCLGVGDPNWMPPSSYNWSLGTNLDWLATMGTSRHFSATGH